MKFDDLERAWQECDRMLDAGIHLNTRRLRSCIREDGELDREIDYSAPIHVVQKQIKQTRPRKWAIVQALEDLAETLHSALLRAFPNRMLRRNRVHRG